MELGLLAVPSLPDRREERRAEFRAEFFNLLNHPNWGNPVERCPGLGTLM